jgi:hypothetical protein
VKYLLFLSLLLSGAVLAQTPGPSAPPKTYTYLIYHKLAPGLTLQDALSVEREWKAINQAAVDEGALIGWHMMVKQMSSNVNPEYDYVSCIVSPVMALRGASPAAMTKIYGDSVQTRMANLQKRDRQTAPVVKFEVWENLDVQLGSGFVPGKTPLVVVDFMKLRDPQTDWLKTMTQLKTLGAAQVAGGQLAGWGFSALTVPNGSEKGYSFAMYRPVGNLNALAGVAEAKNLDEQKLRTKTFETVRQEVFRFELFTLRPGVGK